MLTGTTLRIHRCRGHFFGKALRQPSDSRDVKRLLIHLGNAAANDLAHVGRVNTRTLQCPSLNLAQQICWHQASQSLASLTDGASRRFNNINILHCDSLLYVSLFVSQLIVLGG